MPRATRTSTRTTRSSPTGNPRSPRRRRDRKAPVTPRWFTRPASKRTRGFLVIRWIQTHCVFTNGEWIGQRARLLLWEKLFLLALFAVDANGIRIIRWALLGIPKKNGKTELAAWLACFMAVGDGEPSALVVIAAGSDEQADLLYGAAKRCCEMSPTLSQIAEPYEKEILFPDLPGTKILRVSAAVGTNDGKNIHCVICDELHEWLGKKGRAVWTVLTNGTGARRQPLVLQITTAGHDLETICGEQYEYGVRVAEGEVTDPRYLFVWYEAAQHLDYRKPDTWRSCNPSWGRTLPEPAAFFQDQLTKKRESEFRRYFLNQWVESEELWELAQLWDGLAGEVFFDPELPIHVMTDVALRRDSCAVVAAQRQDEDVVVFARIWENPYPPSDRRHGEWKYDVAEIEQYLRELRADFPADAIAGQAPGPAFYYDPHFFERSAQLLEGEGLLMVEYPQTDLRMVPASQTFFEIGKLGLLVHDGDPAFRRHVRSVTPKESSRGWRISKPKGSRKKIDAAVAAAVAVHEAMREQESAGVAFYNADDLRSAQATA